MIISFSETLFSAELSPAISVEGRPFNAELLSIESPGRFVFMISGQKRQMPMDDLVFWGSCREFKAPPVVVTTNGGLIVAEKLSLDNNSISAESIIFGQFQLPLTSVSGVIFKLPGAIKDRDSLFDGIAKSKGDTDRLLLDNDDELTGALEGLADNKIKLKTEVGSISIEIERVRAVVINSALGEKTSAKKKPCTLGFADGSRFPADSVNMSTSALEFSALGQKWKADAKNLVYVQPSSGRITYLSDLKPAEYRFAPFLDMKWPYCFDRNVTGAWLRFDGKIYLKGVGMHSAARLTYNLDQPYKQFQAETAVDAAADGKGSVRFRVFVDGRDKYTGEIIRGNDKPKPISLDIAGAKQIELIIEYADQADVLDYADWLNARLIK